MDECFNNWESNFDLFGGTDNSSSVITLYNYSCRSNTTNKKSSVLFLNQSSSNKNNCTLGSPNAIFLPGKLKY